jgi:hypothetical protein
MTMQLMVEITQGLSHVSSKVQLFLSMGIPGSDDLILPTKQEQTRLRLSRKRVDSDLHGPNVLAIKCTMAYPMHFFRVLAFQIAPGC